MLAARSSSQLDHSFIRGSYEDLDVFLISQSYSGLPRRSIRSDIDRGMLFKQTLRDVERMYKIFGVYDIDFLRF